MDKPAASNPAATPKACGKTGSVPVGDGPGKFGGGGVGFFSMPGRELWLDGAGRFGGGSVGKVGRFGDGRVGWVVIGDSDARGDVMLGIESEKD